MCSSESDNMISSYLATVLDVNREQWISTALTFGQLFRSDVNMFIYHFDNCHTL